MIDLSTIGLHRSERMRKPAKRMNLMAMIKGSTCFLRYVDHQQQQQQLINGTLNFIHPLALIAKASDTDTFHYKDAMQQPNQTKFILAMAKEIKDLNNAEVWELEE